MTKKEYSSRLCDIRILVNELCNDLGSTYNTAGIVLEKVLNDAMNGDLERIKPKDKKTRKIISIVNFRDIHSKEFI